MKEIMATAEQKELWKKQYEECMRFFNTVAEELKDTHEVIGSKSKNLVCRTRP